MEAPWRDAPETPAGDWLSVPKRKTDRRVEPGLLRQLAAELPGMLAGVRDVYQEQQATPSMTVPTTPGLGVDLQMALMGQYAAQDRARAGAAQQSLSRRDAEQRMDRQEQREDGRWTRQEQQAEARQRQGRLYQVTVPTEDGGTRTEWRSIGLDPETNAPMDYGSILGPEQPGKQGPMRQFSPGQMLMQPDGTWSEVPYPETPPPAWMQRGRVSAGSGGGRATGGATAAAQKPLPTIEINRLEGMDTDVLIRARDLGQLTPQQEPYVAEILASREQRATARAAEDAAAEAAKKEPGYLSRMVSSIFSQAPTPEAEGDSPMPPRTPEAMTKAFALLPNLAVKAPEQAVDMAKYFGIPVETRRRQETVNNRMRIVTYYVFAAGTPQELVVEVD
jgi:hypothetical protein